MIWPNVPLEDLDDIRPADLPDHLAQRKPSKGFA